MKQQLHKLRNSMVYMLHTTQFTLQIITYFLGTLFVGRCTSDGLLHTAYYTFVNQSYLVPENIISLSMDGPSVNKLFDVRSCPLHTVSNGFSEGLNEVDLDQFAVNLHSSQLKKIEEYSDMKKFTEVYGQRLLD